MVGVSNKDYITYYPGFLFYLFFKVTEVKLKIVMTVAHFVSGEAIELIRYVR
jgi:hypothetical protein